jgi:hypothetical protein
MLRCRRWWGDKDVDDDKICVRPPGARSEISDAETGSRERLGGFGLNANNSIRG